MKEIKFFEQQHEKPPHDDSHVACGTPNPPKWCYEDPNSSSVDMYSFTLVIMAILLIFIKYKNNGN